MSDYEELHKERTRAIEEQTEAIERQQAEIRRQREEIRRQRKEAQQRYEEQQQKEKFNAALSECKYCGKKIAYDSTNNFYEYCSKKCVESDLGRDQYDNYMANGEKILSEQLDELIARGKGLTAAIISQRMTHFTAEQTVFLTKQFASDLPVIGNNPARVIELLEPGFYSAPDTLKISAILAFYAGYNKRISRLVAGYFLTYLFQENPSVIKNCEKTLRHDLLKNLHNFSMDSEVKNPVFLILILQEMASMNLERKKAFVIKFLRGNGEYDVPDEVCWNITDRIFKCIGNSDTAFSEKVYDLWGENCGWAENAESETLNEIINSRRTEIQLKEKVQDIDAQATNLVIIMVVGLIVGGLLLLWTESLTLFFIIIFLLVVITLLKGVILAADRIKTYTQMNGQKPNLLTKLITAQCDQTEAFAVDDIDDDTEFDVEESEADIDFDSSMQAAEAAPAPVAVAAPAPVAVAAPAPVAVAAPAPVAVAAPAPVAVAAPAPVAVAAPAPVAVAAPAPVAVAAPAPVAVAAPAPVAVAAPAPVAVAAPAPVAVAAPAPVAVAAPAQAEEAPLVIEFYCIHCGGCITTDAENAGSEGECPYCQKAVTVPTEA